MRQENFRKASKRKLIHPAVELAVIDVRSRFNVGAMFRTSDAVGISRIHLLGYTPKPPHKEIDKVSLGAEKTVSFSTNANPLTFLKRMKKKGYEISAIELGKGSIAHYKYRRSSQKLLLIVGNEVTGLDRKVLQMCDNMIAIPMRGKKKSLNVGIAMAVVAYRIAFP